MSLEEPEDHLSGGPPTLLLGRMDWFGLIEDSDFEDGSRMVGTVAEALTKVDEAVFLFTNTLLETGPECNEECCLSLREDEAIIGGLRTSSRELAKDLFPFVYGSDFLDEKRMGSAIFADI